MCALNLPSATDVERLERRLRSFSQRLEEVEDQIDGRRSRELGATARAKRRPESRKSLRANPLL